MELNWLKYFYEVAKTESVTDASKRMRVSQPAVTKMVKQLEESLGYSLFRKSGRKIQLTQEGLRLYQDSHRIFKAIDHALRPTEPLSSEHTETIRLGASDSICHYWMPDWIKKSSKAFPKVDWSIFSGTSSDIKLRLLSGEIDYGLFFTQLTQQDQSRLDAQQVVELPFALVFSPQLGKWKTLEQLKKSKPPYVGARSVDYSNTVAEHWIYEQLKLQFSKITQANTKELQKRLVLQGLGVGIFPRMIVEQELKKKQLLEVKINHVVPVYLVSRKHEPVSEWFQRFLKSPNDE